ncbi:dihydrolipoyl dehydrogenase family protein [Anaeromicrobium sediminis]|uniref:Dihydrolipoyl dehydrogenase n=1 Tax=Anaeromicrobium sediminis TaxID=1478221 RepID=A0A267MGI7_9FIRM|nr:NAD(P)/FAD-dependent oxidoreductase [Anaeromicrobium sediminis]PAB58689.1 hypothetical protein CCE28_13545 [Anaeromicrobium sediminis]
MKYDVVVLGAGPAGYYFVKEFAKSGKSIALIEKYKLGGVGLRTGCLPVKKYLDTIRNMNKAKGLIDHDILDGKFSSQKLYESVKGKLSKVESMMEDELNNLNVDMFYGECEFIDENTIVIDDKRINFQRAVLATGTNPIGLGEHELDEEFIISHMGAIEFDKLPESICIIGANVEGIEFASLFSSLGVKVTVIDMDTHILQGNDEDLKKLSINYLKENNVTFILGEKAEKIEKYEGKVKIVLGKEEIRADKVLVTGLRKPNIPKGLENIGLKYDENHIPVDNNFKTNVDNIYAIGDINGTLGMAHVAINQGIELADYLERNIEPMREYTSLPRSIYTIYEITGAGFQENELMGKNINYRVEKTYFKDTFRGFSKDIKEGFLKIIIDENERVIGIWISSENASDLIGQIGLWIDEGVTIDYIKKKLFIHPTLGEAILDTAIKF